MSEILAKLSDYAAIGPLLSGVALSIGSAIAATTLVYYNLRVRDDDLYDKVSKIYQRLWDDDKLFRVRRWIESDTEFLEIQPALSVLTAHSDTIHRPLTLIEAKNIDRLDRFCALMTEAYFLRSLGNNKRRKKFIDAMFLDYWMDRFVRRYELEAFIAKFWPELAGYYRNDRRPKKPKSASRPLRDFWSAIANRAAVRGR